MIIIINAIVHRSGDRLVSTFSYELSQFVRFFILSALKIL